MLDQTVILPDGQRICLTGTSYSLSGTTISFTLSAGATMSYTAGSTDEANTVMQQLDNLKLSGQTGLITVVVSLAQTYTSVTPNTGSATGYFSGVITGANFLNLNPATSFRFQNAGITLTSAIGHTIIDDTTLAIDSDMYYLTADTYKIEYTVDGSTYTDTGLTVVLS